MAAVEGWVPEGCTLPTGEQPVRVQEFDQLFAAGVRAQSRVSESVLRWVVDPGLEAVVRDLAARESECCSFFSFGFAAVANGLEVTVQVPPAQSAVLDALAAQAAAVLAQ